MDKCGGVIDAAQETLVLALKVGERSLLDSPETIEKILNDPRVQRAIKKAAEKQARELVKKQTGGKTVTTDDVQAGAKAVATAAADPALKSAEEKIKSTREFKKLEASVKELECAYRKSPVGIFVDKHELELILIGAGLAIGGATAMYVFRTGDELVNNPLADMAKKLVKKKFLGNIEVAAKEITFRPSERVVGTKILTTGTWERVTVKFELGATFKELDVQNASGRGDLSVKVTKGLKLDSHAMIGYARPEESWQNPMLYDLGLKLTYDNAFGLSKLTISTMAFATQDPKLTKFGSQTDLSLNLVGGTKPVDPSLAVTAGLGANRTTELQPIGPPIEQGEVKFVFGITGRL